MFLLTHDYNLVFDYAYKVSFRNLKPCMYYFYNDKGIVNEIRIKSEKLHHIVQYYKKRSKDKSLNKIIRLVNLRKFIELIYGDKSDEYHVLSSLEHGKKVPERKNYQGIFEVLNETEAKRVIERIIETVDDFEYDIWLDEIKNITLLKKSFSRNN